MGGDQGMAGMPAGQRSGSGQCFGPGQPGTLALAGHGPGALAVVGAIVYAASSRSLDPDAGLEPDLAADPEARRLVVELADLEDAYDAGQVDEATYESRRAEIVRGNQIVKPMTSNPCSDHRNTQAGQVLWSPVRPAGRGPERG